MKNRSNREAMTAAIATDKTCQRSDPSEGKTVANRKPIKENTARIQAQFAKLRREMDLPPCPQIDARLAKANPSDLPEIV